MRPEENYDSELNKALHSSNENEQEIQEPVIEEQVITQPNSIQNEHDITTASQNVNTFEASSKQDDIGQSSIDIIQSDESVQEQDQVYEDQLTQFSEAIDQVDQQDMLEVDQNTEGMDQADDFTTTSDDDPSSTSEPFNKKAYQKEKRSMYYKKHRSAIIMTSCFVLAGIGGFSGTLLANASSANGAPVFYQSVDNSGSGSANTTNASGMSVKDVADKTMNSVVEIKTESMTTNDFFQQAITSGAGSGVILSKDGYIVTNNHVIEGASKVSVTTKDGKQYSATLVGTDSTTDLAVIKIEASDLTPAVLGDSDKLNVGDTAIAIGNPLGSLGGTVTTGIISALDREITIDNETMHLLQTNAAINPGNSGGGLFNDKGELIGVVNAKSSGNNIEGLGFAIPISKAKPVITSLMENGRVTGRAELGVSLVEAADNQGGSPFGGNESSETFVYINSVQEGKAADNAGLQRGDKILEVDGKEITSVSEVKSIVTSHSAGDKMTMKIERNGQEKTVTITLQEAVTGTTEKTAFNGGSNA